VDLPREAALMPVKVAAVLGKTISRRRGGIWRSFIVSADGIRPGRK
jgi:hypothetical protein